MRNVTMMIKSKGFNQIRKVLKPNGKKGRPSTLSIREKYDQIEVIINSLSKELQNYRIEKKEKKRIEVERIERGYKPKKKTSKAEYEAMKASKVA